MQIVCSAENPHGMSSLIFSEKKKKKIKMPSVAFFITKTCLYNFDPLKPYFYIVKLGVTGVDIIFLISAQNIDCEYLLEPPC